MKIKKSVKTAVVFLSLFIVWIVRLPAWAEESETTDSEFTIDYSEIDEALNQMTNSENISFGDIVSAFFRGDLSYSFQSLLQFIFQKIFGEIQANWRIMLTMIGIGVSGALFANLAASFAGQGVVNTGFYLTYIVMFTMLAASFASASSIALSVLNKLIELMKVIIPAFGTAVTVALGVTTAQAWYQMLLMLVVGADWVMTKFLVQFIKIYVIMSVVNQMSEEDYFSKMCELFQTAISWSFRTILAVTLGINLIQNMVLPAYDSVKNGILSKLSSAIPGVGNALGAVAKAAIGSGVLLKNAVGAAGVVVICVACALPLIQLFVIGAMYKCLEAIMQPVTDPRLIACIHATGEGIFMLLKAVGTVMLLFIISLAMMTGASNVGLSM